MRLRVGVCVSAKPIRWRRIDCVPIRSRIVGCFSLVCLRRPMMPKHPALTKSITIIDSAAYWLTINSSSQNSIATGIIIKLHTVQWCSDTQHCDIRRMNNGQWQPYWCPHYHLHGIRLTRSLYSIYCTSTPKNACIPRAPWVMAIWVVPLPRAPRILWWPGGDFGDSMVPHSIKGRSVSVSVQTEGHDKAMNHSSKYIHINACGHVFHVPRSITSICSWPYQLISFITFAEWMLWQFSSTGTEQRLH